MNKELKEAANRFAAGIYGSEAPHDSTFNRDAATLASAYLADLAAREAEERERALPIDEVWLRPLCRSVSTQEAFWFIDEDIFLVRWAGGFNLKMNNREIAQQATRGDLLDLLAGLKINTKGGAE